jgi:hypothetical protein
MLFGPAVCDLPHSGAGFRKLQTDRAKASAEDEIRLDVCKVDSTGAMVAVL